jgi:hypothetical protein
MGGNGKIDNEYGELLQQVFDFEIGVWDPSEGMALIGDADDQPIPLVPIVPIQNGFIPKNGLRLNPARDEEISELIAIGNDSTIHNYGDIDDDDDDDGNFNFQILMHNKMTASDLGDVLQCADVGEAGWGDNEDLENRNIEINDETLPLVCN